MYALLFPACLSILCRFVCLSQFDDRQDARQTRLVRMVGARAIEARGVRSTVCFERHKTQASDQGSPVRTKCAGKGAHVAQGLERLSVPHPCQLRVSCIRYLLT